MDRLSENDRAVLALVDENLALRCALAVHRPEFADMPGAKPPRVPLEAAPHATVTEAARLIDQVLARDSLTDYCASRLQRARSLLNPAPPEVKP